MKSLQIPFSLKNPLRGLFAALLVSACVFVMVPVVSAQGDLSGGGMDQSNQGGSQSANLSGGTTQGSTAGSGAVVAGSGPSLYSLLPAKTKKCWQDGNCSLDDIIFTGTAFANLLVGLSGALFLVAFVYGGAMYLMSFGRKEYVDKGKKAMTSAVFGILIVMGAWTIVNYVASSLTGKAI
jgi:hypothetical protein